MIVKNFTNERGNGIPNQFNIHSDDGRFFQSYNSIIVKIDRSGNVFLDEKYWNFSKTTGKYRNIFLGMTTDQIKKKIKTGEFKLINLN